MRNPLFVLLALCLSFSFVFAQTDLGDQKPVHLIERAKAANKNFKAAPIVQKSVNQEVTTSTRAEASEFTLLDLVPQELNALTTTPQEAISMTIPTNSYGEIELELIQVDINSDMIVRQSSTNDIASVEATGIFYRGIVKNDPTSLVSISVFEDEVAGIISISNIGNLVIGKLKSEEETAQHIIYNDIDVMDSHELGCETEDDDVEYTREQLDYHVHARNSANCVEIYLEVDHDIYQDFGGLQNTLNYISSLFNEVATLYANDGVTIKVSEIFIWDTPSPYNGTSSSQMLSQFQQQTNSINGNLGMLVSYQASGGIAVLDGVCHSLVDARLCFSSISSSFNQVPTYSWSVMVMAHELGHLMGSRHTHACVWNGNNTAIDGCAGFTEGNCPLPPNPSQGGTIMSYCHITSVGINFTRGFGTQPSSVILSTVDNASCLAVCGPTCSDGIQNGDEEGVDCGGSSCSPCPPDNGGGDDPVCTDNTLILDLQLDDYSFETTWAVYDNSGDMIFEVGPYEKEEEGSLVRDTFCVPDGCYTFEIYDAYGDGICCEYGNGYYKLRTIEGETLAQGGEFDTKEATNFCVPDDYSNSGDCMEINFLDNEVISFGGSQDAGNFQVQEGGRILKIENNAWKAIALPYTVTENTVIEFDFGSTLQGEIHGIGFDDNSSISSSKTFKVHGTQNWGINTFDNYAGGNTWQHYTIPVGDFYTGEFIYLFFVADHDSGTQNGNSFFRDVVIHEGANCVDFNNDEDNESDLFGGEVASLNVFPNPASNFLNLEVKGMQSDNTVVQVFNLMGQLVISKDFTMLQGLSQGQLDVSQLTQGSYIVRLQDGKEELVQKFTVTR